MIQSKQLGFLLFSFMMLLFFIIPGIEIVQKPFRILLCGIFPIIWAALIIKKEISYRTITPVIGATILMALMAIQGTLQSSFINVWLSLFGLLTIDHLFFEMTDQRRENLRYLFLLALLSFLIQLLNFSYQDGRPTLAYEINLSGAYLFLFFLAAEVLNFKVGKWIVMAISLFLLSRLLIFSIIIYFLVKSSKGYFIRWINKVNALTMALTCYLLVCLFSVWYTSNVKSQITYESGPGRIVRINDGSNKLRFQSNSIALKSIATWPVKKESILGYGPIENFLSAHNTRFMPHNEVIDGIVEFGLLTVIFLSLFTMKAFNKLVSFSNIEYFIPLLFYTSILWVRYLLIPSPEMLFILFLLYLSGKKLVQKEIAITTI